MRRSLARLVLVTPALTGCSAMVGGEAGYAHAFAQAPERSAAVVNGYAGFGAGDDHFGMGFGGSLRIKASDVIGQFSIAPIFYLVAGAAMTPRQNPRAAFFALTGVDLVTVESVANIGSVSIGSPFIEAGVFVRCFGNWGFAPAVMLEDDIRFNSIPNTAYASFVLGFSQFAYEGFHPTFAKPTKQPDK